MTISSGKQSDRLSATETIRFANQTPRVGGRFTGVSWLVIWPLITLILVGVVWQLSSSADSSPARVIPTLTEIWAAFLRNQGTLFSQHIPTTLIETLIGMALSLAIGIVLAALLDWSEILRKALYPLLVISQTIPLPAIAIVLILVFGFGLEPKVIVVVLYCTFPITVATLDGLTGTDSNAMLLLQSFGASRWQIWRKVRFPSALPGLFSGLRIAATYSVSSAIFGEYVSSNQGLGQYMRQAYAAAHTDQAFVAIIITALLSIGLVGVVAGAERIIIRWHYARLRAARWDRVTGNY